MQNIVIIGGGIAGQHLAEELVKSKANVTVTLVTASRFAEFGPAMPLVLCHPELHHKALAGDPKTYQHAQVEYKYGIVSGLDMAKKHVQFDSEHIPYDVVVVSSGFGLPIILPKLGATLEERKEEVQMVGKAIKSANHVLVGGGGPIALEMAGNVKAQYPSKKVTVICKSVLPQYGSIHRAAVEAQLEKLGINVHTTTERCPIDAELKSCQVLGIEGDIYIPCFSQGPNTKFLESSAALDQSGKIKVNKYLQSPVCTDMFAVGCSDVHDWVSIPKLTGQWQTVAKNVLAQLKGSPMSEYKEKEPQMKHPPAVYIGLGKRGWALIDFEMLPAPLKCCCCNGLGGFPCCPPPCCWPCLGPCLCGYCCGSPNGSGLSALFESTLFGFGKKMLKGLGEDAPTQQKMA